MHIGARIDIELEQREYDEICEANGDLREQYQQQRRRSDELKTETAAVQAEAERERAAYDALRAEHDADVERKQRRLQTYQDLLGLSIDTVKGIGLF
jgi:predicted nuclease with TOPRIM domain